MDISSAVLHLLPLAGSLLIGRTLDTFLVLSFITFRKWGSVYGFISDLNLAVVVGISLLTTYLFASVQLYRYVSHLQWDSTPCSDFPVKPMLFPSETAHVRLFPEKHGFVYSYLMVGIPVGWRGKVGGMISCDTEDAPSSWLSTMFSLRTRKAWYSVSGDDYLNRGHVRGGLEEKLKMYLGREGIDSKQYAYCYLLTAARFLNYASNPVSIWYLYSSDKKLAALILEVNNTFDEKRIYFLEPSSSPAKPGKVSKPTRYTHNWPKDFYVSVFNSRNGSYSLTGSDPLAPNMTGAGPIDTTITLNNSSGHAKLVARVYSAGAALNPATMSVWEKTRFLAKWWWVGLATFPRTVREALTLLFTKKMPWVFRPEPRRETTPRKADALEMLIEAHFRSLLRRQVESSEESVVVSYKPAGLVGLDAEEEVIVSPSAQLVLEGRKELAIRVLTPLFYSRLVQYQDVEEALIAESAESAPTISISTYEQLAALFLPPTVMHHGSLSPLDQLFLRLLSWLRKRPSPIAIPSKEQAHMPHSLKPPITSGNVRNFSLPLESHVFTTTSDTAQEQTYSSHVLKLMLAEHVALGWMEILDLEILVLRGVLAWGVVRACFA